MDRTEAQSIVRKAAFDNDISVYFLTSSAAFNGIFTKPGTEDKYSHSWIIDRLKHNDKKVAEKLVCFAKSLGQ